MFQDYAREVVPADKAVSGWRIGLIFVGVGLTLPAFMMGSIVGADLGFYSGLGACFIAGLILTVMGACTGWIGAKVKLSTYYILQLTFGSLAGKFMTILLAATMFGWFGVTISLFGQAVNSTVMLPFMDERIWGLLGGALMIGTAVCGFRGLDKLTWVAVPMIVMVLIWTMCQSLQTLGWSSVVGRIGTQDIGWAGLISMMVGAWASGAAILPDLSRYARKPADGVLAAVLCFLIGFVAIMAMVMIPAIATGMTEIVTIMLAFGIPYVTAFMIILASWSSNDNNLYSGSLGLASIIPDFAKWRITLIAGVVGTTLGFVGIADNFVGFLMFLGILVPPIAGTYIAYYFLNSDDFDASNVGHLSRINPIPVCAWVMGSIVAYISATYPSLLTVTSIPALDGLLSASIVVCFLNWVKVRRLAV